MTKEWPEAQGALDTDGQYKTGALVRELSRHPKVLTEVIRVNLLRRKAGIVCAPFSEPRTLKHHASLIVQAPDPKLVRRNVPFPQPSLL